MQFQTIQSPHTHDRQASLISCEQIACSGLTEIWLPHNPQNQLFLPYLAFLSRMNHDRWLTWIAPHNISKSMLAHYGFDFSRTRFIYSKCEEQDFWLLWEALAQGNSHTVLGSPNFLSDFQKQRLEEATLTGHCQCLLLRERPWTSH